jgi:Putative carbonic anhydrase
MAHVCGACVVTCEDFRLHLRPDGRNAIGDYIRGLGIDCDLITRGGAVQDIVRPRAGFDESLLRDIEVSVDLHEVKAVHLVNHEDCGAYGEYAFASRDSEFAQHHTDLLLAREMIRRRFPDVEIVLAFGELDPGSNDTYVVRQLD